MIRTIIVDDEKHVIDELVFHLRNYSEIDIIRTYNNPMDVLGELSVTKPDIIFLDIQMPGMSGLIMAKKIRDLLPLVEIIFVTAFSEYTFEAFDVYALDYILKPIDDKRFNQTMLRLIERIGKSRNVGEVSDNNKRLRIISFGHFEMYFEGQKPIKWRTEKTKEVFLFLLMHNGETVTKEKILDELWREYDVNKAQKQLHNCIYYVRKALEEYGITGEMIRITDIYRMTLGDVYWDVRTFDELINKDIEDIDIESIHEIYKGELLEEIDWEWLDIERSCYKACKIKVLLALVDRYLTTELYTKAEETALIAYKESTFNEEAALSLMKIYQQSNQKLKGILFYKEYRKLLMKELGVGPNTYMKNLYKMMKTK